jgi:hypothetical protein
VGWTRIELKTTTVQSNPGKREYPVVPIAASNIFVSTVAALVVFSVGSHSLAGPPVVEQKIRYFHSIKPDCSTTGTVTVRVVNPPTNGRIDVRQNLDFPNFPRSNPRSTCNTTRVPSTEVWYVPNPGFAGADSATFEATYPSGQVLRVLYQYVPSGKRRGWSTRSTKLR